MGNPLYLMGTAFLFMSDLHLLAAQLRLLTVSGILYWHNTTLYMAVWSELQYMLFHWLGLATAPVVTGIANV